MKKNRTHYGFRSGVSLIIAVFLISVIVLFAMAVSNLVISSLRSSANVNRANEAFFAAEGALESGLLANQQQGAGYTTDTANVALSCSGSVCPTSSVKIQGQVPSTSMIDGQYIVPTPGTGTAGKNCDPLKAVTSGDFPYDDKAPSGPNDIVVAPPAVTVNTSTAPAIKNPCNWNKIKVSETVAIPLYVATTDSSKGCTQVTGQSATSYICNPKNLGLSTLNIKIRTPCDNGAEMCPDENRFDLNNGPENGATNALQYNGDDPIVSWQITGTDANSGASYTLQPAIDQTTYDFQRSTGWRNVSSVIYESKINLNTDPALDAASDYVVLSQDKKGIENDNSSFNGASGSILDFLKNNDLLPPPSPWKDRVITKPVLKLSVIHSLEDIHSNKIPYLEYQVVTDMTNLLGIYPADSAQTIHAEGFSGEFKWVLEVKQPQETGLLEYVIQQ